MRRARFLLALLPLVSFACSDEPVEPVIEPLFPADYASSYQEVRNCRRSFEHDLMYIRVLTEPTSTSTYQNRDAEFRPGAIVLKEEYDNGDERCAGPIVQWTVMTRATSSSSPSTLDWRWQMVSPDRKVLSVDEFRCINCHKMCGEPPEGHDGTCAMP